MFHLAIGAMYLAASHTYCTIPDRFKSPLNSVDTREGGESIFAKIRDARF